MVWATASIARRTPASLLSGELSGYLSIGDQQLYHVLHLACGRRVGQVLLAGAFAHRSLHCHPAWVRWARYLALHGFEVIRFDYRGVGESTGDFAKMHMGTWLEDIQHCARRLRDRGEGCPLVLHGLEFGGQLAARAFAEGVGDALLAWCVPPSIRELLLHCLRRKWTLDYAVKRSTPRMTVNQCIASMESGQSLEVDGYFWSPRLWRDSGDEQWIANFCGDHKRPVRCSALDEHAGPLFLPVQNLPRQRYDIGQLCPDLSGLFRREFTWIARTSKKVGRSCAR